MNAFRQPAPSFLGASFFAYLLSTIGWDTVARTGVGGQTLGEALREHFFYAAVQLPATFIILLPFLILAFMAASTSRRSGVAKGVALLVVFLAVLSGLRFYAYQGAQSALQQDAYTAAALSDGLLAIAAWVLLLVAFLAHLILIMFFPASHAGSIPMWSKIALVLVLMIFLFFVVSLVLPFAVFP